MRLEPPVCDTMNKRFLIFVSLSLCRGFFVLLTGIFFFSSHVVAQGGGATRVQGRLDDTILHVDKYGVYVPKRVFYWDSTLSKQKVDALIKAAERLRNKRATIVYSAQDDLERDRHPLVADIVPSKDEGASPGLSNSREAHPSTVEPAAPTAPAASTAPVASTASTSPSAPTAPDASSRQAHHPPDAVTAPGSATAPRPVRQETSIKEPATGAADPVQELLFHRKGEESRATSSPAAAFSRDRVRAFVQQLLALNERKDLAAILLYYGDQVDYYDRGVVTRDYIRRDMGYYFRNWDSIRSTLDGDVVTIVTDEPDVRILKYVSSYAVENSKKALSGRTENIWKVRRVGEEWKIIDVKQQRVVSETQ